MEPRAKLSVQAMQLQDTSLPILPLTSPTKTSTIKSPLHSLLKLTSPSSKFPLQCKLAYHPPSVVSISAYPNNYGLFFGFCCVFVFVFVSEMGKVLLIQGLPKYPAQPGTSQILTEGLSSGIKLVLFQLHLRFMLKPKHFTSFCLGCYAQEVSKIFITFL